MNAAAATFVEDSVETLAALSKGADRLAWVFLAESEAATDPQDRRAATDLYLRAFQAFRLGLALTMKIIDPTPVRLPRDLDVRERPERDTADREPRERDDERDRDYEPVSLPRFLSTLGAVTKAAEARAERLPDDLRTETLPTLKALLAKAKAEPAPAKPGLAILATLSQTAPPPAANARSRLLNSTSRTRPPLRGPP